MRFFSKIAAAICICVAISFSPFNWAQENNSMRQFDNLSLIEQLINQSLLRLGIDEAKIIISPEKEGTVQATVSYNGKEKKIIFSKEEVENARKGNFSPDTKRKILDSITTLAPKIGPPFKSSN